MKYIVLAMFTDLQDDNHKYEKGDVFPRDGKKVTKKRVTELSSSKNKRGVPLIKPIEEK